MKQKIASASLWFTALSLAASAVNFLYYPVIARFLNLAQFGDVQIGVSFVMQAAALFSSLNLVALFISAGNSNVKHITNRLERILITPSIIAAVLVIILAQPISHLLQLHDASLLYLLAVIFILNIPASTWIGTLQGEGHFLWSGGISLIASLVKIISSVLLIAGGMGAHGAIIGIMLGTLVIIPLAFMVQRSNSLNLRETFRPATKTDFSFLLKNRSIALILSTFFGLALLATFDTLFAKLHLTPTDAGSFAQLSIVAKIPYFVFLPISIVLFSRFITDHRSHLKALGLYSLSVLISSAAVYIALPLLSRILFQLELSPVLRSASLYLVVAFAAFTIANLFVYFVISRGYIALATYAVGAIFLLTTGALIASADTISLAGAFAATQCTAALLLLALVGYTSRNAR